MSDLELERRIATLLRAPAAVDQDLRGRIMDRVRETARARAPRRRLRSMSTRSSRHSFVGLLMAASIGSVAVLSSVVPPSARMDDRRAATGDSIFGRLRDTLLLERVIRDGDHRFAFVVDGARWAPDPASTPARSADRLPAILRVASDSN